MTRPLARLLRYRGHSIVAVALHVGCDTGVSLGGFGALLFYPRYPGRYEYTEGMTLISYLVLALVQLVPLPALLYVATAVVAM